MHRTLFIGLFLLVSVVQAQVVDETVLWTNYTVKKSLDSTQQLSFNVQRRDFLDRDNFYHLYFNLAYSRRISNGFGLTGGMINLNINRFVDTDHVLVPEIRPFQRIQYARSFKKSKVYWHFMIEERWRRNASQGELIDGYRFNFRYRNMLRYQFVLIKGLQLQLSTEVYFNSGKEGGPPFDQHRGSVLGIFKVGGVDVSAGYRHWAVQTGDLVMENRHVIVLGVSHSF